MPKPATPLANAFPIIAFPNQIAFREWLTENHAAIEGIWLQFYKKDSGVATISFAEALDEALCFGWIDGQLKRHDERSWIHKFTPRRPKSTWSKRNIEHVERLIQEGKMTQAGLRQIELAKNDGRWQIAYDPPSAMQVPDDFLALISKDKKAKAFFETLNRANRYSIAWRLQTAKKPETREKRMKEIFAMLKEGKKIH